MGTSMASPMACGVIALMLEANPQLTANDIRIIFKQTAIKDNFTGALPDTGNNIWGLGKINAYRSVKAALEYNFINPTNSNISNIIIFPNPATNNITITSPKKGVVYISNMLGQQIKTFEKNEYNSTIDVSKFPSGIYLIKFETETGFEFIKFTKK
jgi:hypothetical protein